MSTSPLNFLTTVTPEEMGLHPERWNAVQKHAQSLVDSGAMPALAMQIQRGGLTTGTHSFGTVKIDGNDPIDEKTRFLIASLTKPMVAMAVLLLVERGQVALNQRVSELVPEFKGAHKKQITIKNILTHTSGLPDMLPNNRELRKSNAGLMEFVTETAATDLVFPCGTNSQYQSMGYALLGPLIQNVTGIPYQQFIQDELFTPLGMERAALGLVDDEIDDPNIAEARVPNDQVGEDSWNWNSRYWKTFGAPWGGTVATADDVSRFCRCMLTEGIGPGGRIFHESTIRMATTNRLHDFPDITETVRRTRGWGYGWRMNWTDHRGSFGDLLGPSIYGHWGATGTLFWLDRQTETAAVLLSSQPYDRSVSPLVPLSNMICSAFCNENNDIVPEG